MEVQCQQDAVHRTLLDEAARVLALPIEASRLHWHPFGVFAAPLAPRTVDGVRWSRRLHIWHPEAEPVGEASPYGVHTHSGTGRSHVLAGALHHHLYGFTAGDGPWNASSVGIDGSHPAHLAWHVQGTTPAGHMHEFPADRPHGVTKPPGLAISLFEQADQKGTRPFSTWQRIDVPPQPLEMTPPVSVQEALRDARSVLEQRIFAAT